jgi:hypothetical protein
MFCVLVDTPTIEGYATTDSGANSAIFLTSIESPSGLKGNCLIREPCVYSSCNQTDPLPTKVRCWEESLDSSVPVCIQPESFWRTYMYTTVAFGLAGSLFFVIAMYASGCCGNRNSDEEPDDGFAIKKHPKLSTSIPLSSRF